MQYGGQSAQSTLLSLQGETVSTTGSTGGRATISTTGLPQEIYLLRVCGEQGVIQRTLFVK